MGLVTWYLVRHMRGSNSKIELGTFYHHNPWGGKKDVQVVKCMLVLILIVIT